MIVEDTIGCRGESGSGQRGKFAIGDHGCSEYGKLSMSVGRKSVSGVGCAVINYGKNSLTNHCTGLNTTGMVVRRSFESGVQLSEFSR